MGTSIDPGRKEIDGLFRSARFAGARVLEIGSGTGRLALRYAAVSRSVVGLETKEEELAEARRCSPEAAGRMRFVRGSGVSLPFGAGAFDIVLFGWSL